MARLAARSRLRFGCTAIVAMKMATVWAFQKPIMARAEGPIIGMIALMTSPEADIARNRGRISETELQALELDDRFRTDVLGELQTIDGEFAQLIERRTAAEDKLQRLEIKAPCSGRVHELAVHTVGGVVRPGD